jgi:hypothetical protein
VAHFFRRAFGLIREGGVFGLLATNTIRQGDTRDTGLTTIIMQGGTVRRATRRLKWPGEAAVVVSVVHMAKGAGGAVVLDGRSVRRISAYLVEGDLDGSPQRLTANARKAFQGSIVLGSGFTFDDVAAAKGEAESLATMRALITKDPRNAERIFPYIGGEEVTTNPRHAHHRYVIDFMDFPLRREASLTSWATANLKDREAWRRVGVVPDDYPGPVAMEWRDLIEIVQRLVKPTRDKETRKARRERWWRFGDRQPGLYSAVAPLERVLVNSSKATPHHAIGILGVGFVYSQNLNVFAMSRLGEFALMQARSHEIWARFVGTTMKDDFTYTKDDCFETFPFPSGSDASLKAAGQAYHDHRSALMVARKEGMTKTYNRFHDRTETSEDIHRLRELHAAMDRAALDSYGWHDFAARAEPIFLDDTNEDDHTYQDRLFWPSEFRDEVFARLLALNGERHDEEVRLGITPGMKGKSHEDEEDDLEGE